MLASNVTLNFVHGYSVSTTISVPNTYCCEGCTCFCPCPLRFLSQRLRYLYLHISYLHCHLLLVLRNGPTRGTKRSFDHIPELIQGTLRIGANVN